MSVDVGQSVVKPVDFSEQKLRKGKKKNREIVVYSIGSAWTSIFNLC